MQTRVLALLDDIQERLGVAMMQRGQLIEVAPGRSWNFAAFAPRV
ncbi:hypothetical protein [Vreelandella malpeensis]|nr:hypothetical protein [Halomonas malpeensis]